MTLILAFLAFTPTAILVANFKLQSILRNLRNEDYPNA